MHWAEDKVVGNTRVTCMLAVGRTLLSAQRYPDPPTRTRTQPRTLDAIGRAEAAYVQLGLQVVPV